MRHIAFLLLSSLLLHGQQTTTPASVPSGAGATLSVSWLPITIVTAGGGFASPNGKFAYASISKFMGSGTYWTTAQEYTLVNKAVQSCTLTGLTKPMYQFGPFTAGLTGLGGGCSGGSAIGAGQVFFDVRIRGAWGVTLTGAKETSGGFKLTLAPRWAK